MHILVCIKQVVDQEIPPRVFSVNRASRRADVPQAALVMSTFDANALEAALRLRDAVDAKSTVTALSLGDPRAVEVLRKALAVTANAAVQLNDATPERLDPVCVATVIAAAVRRLTAEGRPVDVILTGRQAGDWEHGQTGGMLAEALGWPCLTFVSRLRPTEDGLEAQREIEEGHELITVRPPLVVTITNDETNKPRLPKVRDVMQARRTPIATWGIVELGLDPIQLAPSVEAVDLVVPERESRCELIEGKTAAEKAAALACRLREMDIL